MKARASRAGMKNLRVAFLHPDLGIGGAERLVVDAAVELLNRGHEVTIFTARYDPDDCLEKTRDSRLEIRIAGGLIPHSLAGRVRVPCAIARMALILKAMNQASRPYDIVFCDLVPHAVFLFRMFSHAKILFYCHYPDQLLAPKSNGLYQLYRQPLNWMEVFGMRFAHQILVNSVYTADTFQKTFPKFPGGRPEVLYPGIDTEPFRISVACPAEIAGSAGAVAGVTFLSLNRFDPDKNLVLALDALAALREQLPAETFRQVRLIMAGACDDRLPEQGQTLLHLKARAEQLNLKDQVIFLLSVSDDERIRLLRNCDALLYTSPNEHFGLGIVEAMVSGKPVIAVNRGGPKETVLNGETGFLCDPSDHAFAHAMSALVKNPPRAADMGLSGQRRADEMFSLPVFGARLEKIISSLAAGRHHV